MYLDLPNTILMEVSNNGYTYTGYSHGYLESLCKDLGCKKMGSGCVAQGLGFWGWGSSFSKGFGDCGQVALAILECVDIRGL